MPRGGVAWLARGDGLNTALLLAVVASPAFECAVCGAGEDDPSRTSYIGMTLIISFLPLAMLGGIVGYVFHKSRSTSESDSHEEWRRLPVVATMAPWTSRCGS